MKPISRQAVVTLALFCLLLVLATVPALQVSPPDTETRFGRLGNQDIRVSGLRNQDIRLSAFQLRRCVESGPPDKTPCEVEFLGLMHALEGENRNSLDVLRLGYLDVLLTEEFLILRRTECAADDLAGRVVAWSSWPQTRGARTESGSKYGVYGGYHDVDTEGRRFGTTCLLVIVLPITDLKRLHVALLRADKTQVWKFDQEW